MSFTTEDIKQIENKGLSLETVNEQIELFKKGIPFTNIHLAAIIDDGIIKLADDEVEGAITYFENEKNDIDILKFVPASGAATRMFKFLFQFLNEYDPEKESVNAFINKNKLKDLSLFLVGLEKFPFYTQIIDYLNESGIDFSNLETKEKVVQFIRVMLDEDKLNFGNSPKGLLPFHKYKKEIVSTAFEEHLFETALYTSDDRIAKLHFTISERYKNRFDEEFNRIVKKVEDKTGVKFEISYSYQQESTDTIAVTPKNKPFRNSDGSLLFRPSGHGALIKNLNALNTDLIFIKNIDNVVVNNYKHDVAKYKKVLAGVLLKRQKQVFSFLEDLDKAEVPEDKLIEIAEFLTRYLNIKISEEFKKYSDKYKVEYLREQLNKPIRVCGMVKNEGEPGGGPFWVKHQNGKLSLQIVESAQINVKDENQHKLLKQATHFNPVDIVCGVKNYKGQKFDLENFVDHNAAFITSKTQGGKELKALELPGLWNGSMAFWNTIFVEVPIVTFNPVKTVNDLLKATHQVN